MAGGMKYQWGLVDGATGQIGGMVNSMEQNVDNLKKLATELMAITSGDMSDKAAGIWNNFNNQIDEYKITMRNVGNVIDRTSGSAGDMRNVDIVQGNRFLSIG